MIIVDTGFWIALGATADEYHKQARKLVAELNEGLITTWPVLTETCHILLKRSGSKAVSYFMESIEDGAAEIFLMESTHLKRINTLIEKYSGLPMDLADASLVLLAEELGDGRILTTDKRDFNTYRWKNRKPFVNLFC